MTSARGRVAIGAVVVGTILVVVALRRETPVEPSGSGSNERTIAAGPAQPPVSRAASRAPTKQPPASRQRLRFRAAPDRLDPTTLKRIERADGAVGVVLPKGGVWYGLEDHAAGPERPDVLPVLDLLNRYPWLATRFQESLDEDGFHECKAARTKRQGVIEAEVEWTMIVRASVRDGRFQVDDVSSDTWPAIYDREYSACLSRILAAARWDASDGLSEIAFEYPLRESPPRPVDERADEL